MRIVRMVQVAALVSALPLGSIWAQSRSTVEPTVVVLTDGRDLEIKRASDVQPVRVPVLDRCGDPAVGEAKIRHIRRDKGAVVATYGKHCFAKVSLKNLAVQCTGCD